MERASRLHRDGHWLGELECEKGFGTKVDVFLAREESNRRPGPCAHRAADKRALAATGQRPNQSSSPAPPAIHAQFRFL